MEAPVRLGSEPDAEAWVLRAVLRGLLVLAALSFVLSIPNNPSLLENVFLHGVAALPAVVGLPALARGHVRPTAWLLVVTLWVLLWGISIAYGGLHTVVVFLTPLPVVVAYFLLGTRAGLSVAGLSVAAAVALLALEPMLPAAREASLGGSFVTLLVALGLPTLVIHAAIGRVGRARAHHQSVLQSMGEALIVIDGGGIVRASNPAAARALLGDEDRTLWGTSVRDWLTSDHGEPFYPALPGTVAARLRRRPEVALHATCAPSTLEDGSSGTVIVLTDISALREAAWAQRRARAIAEEASRAKSRFLANMSHELRTPLNAIIGYSEVIQDEAEEIDPAQLRSTLERVIRSARHLLSLISDVLDLSRIEADKLEIVNERFRVRSPVEDVVAALQPLVDAGENTLVVELPDDLGEMEADPLRVRQCLTNLLGNAAKFTEGGTVTVRARRIVLGGGDQVEYEVEDTGIGMSGDQMSRLFQEFVQADASTTRRFGGTGLGLALTRRLCRRMGGDVRVRSELDEGSVFTIALPAEGAQPTSASSA